MGTNEGACEYNVLRSKCEKKPDLWRGHDQLANAPDEWPASQPLTALAVVPCNNKCSVLTLLTPEPYS